MSDKPNNFILPKEYFEMREKNTKRFQQRLYELALHERKSKINSLGH